MQDNGGHANGSSRLDRIEKALEGLTHTVTLHDSQIMALASRTEIHDRAFERVHGEQDEFREALLKLLKYQVLHVEETRRWEAESRDRDRHLDEKLAGVTEKLDEVTGKLNALIDVVDRWPKQQPPA